MKLKKILCVLLVVLLAFPILPACKKAKKTDTKETDPAASVNAAAENMFKGDISAYRQSFIEDITREVTAADRVRDKAYVVSDEKLNVLIDTLDFALGSPDVQGLLGFDLQTVMNTVFDMVYSDKTVNLILQLLYPMVEREFQKVWSEIPDTLEIQDVDTGVKIAPKANVKTSINLDEIETALTAIDFYIFPSTLADYLPEQYAAVSEKLRLAPTKSAYDPATDTLTTAWEDAVLMDEEGKLDLPWGVKDRASFVDALTAGLSGAEPLLLALLSNLPCNKTGDIGTGDGKAAVLGNTLKLDLTVDRIELLFTATANEGYNNTVGPLFELLGVTPPDGNTFTNTRDFIEKGVLAPVDELLKILAAAPVRFALGLLPNVAFAVESGLIKPLLSMLKTDIDYTTNAYYTAQVAGEGMMKDPYRAPEIIKINLGEMLDLGEMGIDISSMNGILGFAGEKLGVALPPIDGRKLAALGTLTWHDTQRTDWTYIGEQAGKAARIDANEADVLLFLLDYVFTALKDPAFRESLSWLLDNLDLPEMVKQIVDKAAADPDTTVAVLTELIVPQTYSAPAGVTFRSFEAGAGKAQTLYNAYWTNEKANYMMGHLPDLINAFLSASDMEIAGISANSLPELVDGIAGMIIKAGTLNTVAGKIAEAIGGLGLPDLVYTLAREKLGVDLNYWKTYNASFADGDRAAFKQGILDLVSPIGGLLNFLLLDEDLSISLAGPNEGESKALVTLQGNDGYTRALVPLLEALGVGNIPSAAEIRTGGTSPISYVVDAVFGIVDGLKTDAFGKLMELMPNLLFFIRSGCLTDVIDNLLYPVNVLLDVVRPVFELDLNQLLGFDLRLVDTDPVTMVFGLVSDLLQEKLGVSITFDFTTQSLYNDLNCWTTETYTSAAGTTAARVKKDSIRKNDMLTVIYDYLLREILFSANTPTYLQFAKEKLGLSDFIFNYLSNVAPAIKEADASYPGAGKALIFWVFFAADSLMGAVNSGNNSILGIASALMGSGSADARAFAAGELTKDMRNEGFSSILGSVLKPLFG